LNKAKVFEPNAKPEVEVAVNGLISHDQNEAAAATEGENDATTAAKECPTSPETGNGYALTDVIDDLMAAEFPETTAPQADSEEVVLLSPTPPRLPAPPPPRLESEPEVENAEMTEDDSIEVNRRREDGEHVAVGHPGTHESRVTFSGPLQFMGRNDLPRDDVTPPLSPVSSPVKLMDVLPTSLREAAVTEASLARSIPLTSGSIDAVTLDDTQSGMETSHVAETSHVDDQQDVFGNHSAVVDTDLADSDQGSVQKTDVAGAVSSSIAVSQACDVPVLSTATVEASSAVSERSDSMG